MCLTLRGSDYVQYPFNPTVVALCHRGFALPWQLYRLFLCVLLHGAVMFMVHLVPKPLFMAYHRFQLRWFSDLDDKAIDEHFNPRYSFGEQRPLGFLEALRDKVSIVTGAPHKVQPDGIVLEDGRVVCADTIVLATGFQLEYFKFRVELDGAKANMFDMTLRRDVFFEGVPNFFQMVLCARLDSKNYTCFTPLVEHAVDFCTATARSTGWPR